MPPKKAKTRAPSPAPAPTTVTTPRGKIVDTTAAASRPKRTTAMPPPDQPTPKRAKTATPQDTPKRRGRPPKNVTSSVTPKGTSKATSKATPKSTPRRAGERQSARLASTPAPDVTLPRPRQLKGHPSTQNTSTHAPPSGVKRGRGRPRKQPVAVQDDAEDDGYDDSTHDANITEATTIIQSTDMDDEDHPNYWLMKAEPESRIEKNANGHDVDVKFSIDDLRARSEPEPWDGIRNAQAQNNMKAMKAGDLAFFYESNCKKPGIVGIMEIVRESSPDVSAFDKNSVYYDPKSDPERPKWMLVHVEFRRKFGQKLTLKELQQFSKPGGALADLGLFKQSRLSVSKVSKPEWDFIISLLEDDDDDDEEEAADVTMGAERPAPAQDLGNDFAAAFEAPDSLRAGDPAAAAGNTDDFVEQMAAFAGAAADGGMVSPALPTKLATATADARSVSRGRASRRKP